MGDRTDAAVADLAEALCDRRPEVVGDGRAEAACDTRAVVVGNGAVDLDLAARRVLILQSIPVKFPLVPPVR